MLQATFRETALSFYLFPFLGTMEAYWLVSQAT